MKLKLKNVYLFFTLMSLTLLNSCNDLPTELGYNLLEDTVVVNLITSNDTTLITGSQNFVHNLNIFNAGAIYIGNAGNQKAYSFLRFGDIPDSLDELSSIETAELIMYPYKYTFGDTNSNTLGFKLFELKNIWTEKFNWDSLSNNPGIINNKSVGEYNKKISFVDSLISSISMPVDKDLILKWFKMQADTNTAKLNYGIALVPDANSNVIRQFSSQLINTNNSSSMLKVTYKNTKGTIDTVYMSAAIEFSVLNKPNFDNNSILVQGGTGLRSKIYFDFTMLPDLAAIHRAQLDLTLNKAENLQGNITVDTMIAFDLYAAYDSLLTKPLVTFYGTLDKAKGKLTCIDFSSGVETWMRTTKKGYLVAKFSGINSEYKRLDRYSFYNSTNSDLTKRPYLKIIYSKRLKSSSNVK